MTDEGTLMLTQEQAERIAAYESSTNELRAKVDHFITVLNTIGTTIYLKGRGAKWEGELLAFIREEMEGLTK